MKNKLSILVGFIMLTGVIVVYAVNENQSLSFDSDGLKIGEKFIPVQDADIDPLRGINKYRDALRDVNNNVWYLKDNGASPEVVSEIKEDASNANIFATAANEKADTAVADATEANEKANSVDAKATQAQIDAADAKEDASTAKSTATEAKSTADAIDDKASQALTNASAAQTASSSALANANTAVENANTAVANAAAATQAVANKVDKSYVDVTAISDGGSILTAVNDDTSDLSKTLDTKIQIKASGVPVGTIVMWGKAEIPDGWLELDGETINPATYPILSELYGTNVPDFRGQFLRGYDPTGTVDKDGNGREILSKQKDAIRFHQVTGRTDNENPNIKRYSSSEGGDGTRSMLMDDQDQGSVSTDLLQHSHSFTSSGITIPASSDSETELSQREVRPKNIAVIYIIKAR